MVKDVVIRVKCIVGTELEANALRDFLQMAQLYMMVSSKITFSFEVEVNMIEGYKRY